VITSSSQGCLRADAASEAAGGFCIPSAGAGILPVTNKLSEAVDATWSTRLPESKQQQRTKSRKEHSRSIADRAIRSELDVPRHEASFPRWLPAAGRSSQVYVARGVPADL
jgi:hypothetical protein